jgi:hypothetical protein
MHVMNATRILLLLPVLGLLGITGCATPSQWSASGGNREIGVVRLSYEYAEREEPQMSEAVADRIAYNRCNTWGYSRAELIPGLLRDCTIEDGNRCEVWKVTREYRCEDPGKDGATLAGNFAR